MSAGSMSTGFDLPGSFQELFGNYKASIREIAEELKALKAEAKRVYKETGQRDRALESRINVLTGDKERLMKLQNVKNRVSAEKIEREERARTAARVLRGRVKLDDVEGLTEAVARRLIRMGGAGSLSAKAGVAINQAVQGASSAIATLTPVAMIAGASAYATSRALDLLYKNDARQRFALSQSNIQFETAMFKEFQGVGLSGRLSGQEMVAIRKAAMAEGQRAAGNVASSSLSRKFLTKVLGWEQSEAATAAQTQAQNREFNRRMLAKIHPAAAQKATRAGVRANWGGQIEQRLKNENMGLWMAGKLNEYSKTLRMVPGFLAFAGVSAAGDLYNIDGHLEAERQKLESEFQDKALASPEKSAQSAMAKYITNPTLAMQRAQAHETRRQIRAVETDRRLRFNDWSAY